MMLEQERRGPQGLRRFLARTADRDASLPLARRQFWVLTFLAAST